MSEKGVVAAGHPETCRVAQMVLADGGNAVDAALAAMCAACVVEPVLASLGGGGFLMVRPAAGRLARQPVLYDFFTHTPKVKRPADDIDCQRVDADFGATTQEFHIGLGTIATPGAVKGLFEAHRDFGRMPMRRLVEPAVELARVGARITGPQAQIMSVVAAILRATAAHLELFESPVRPGELISEGEALRMPAFAGILEILACEGDDLFYRGEIGRRLVADCAGRGGHLVRRDLESYRVERRTPIAIDAFACRILLNPPPSLGGLLVAFAIELLEALGLDFARHSVDHLRRVVHVLSAADRMRREQCLDRSTVALLDTVLARQNIALHRDDILRWPTRSRGTTHISVVDQWDCVASLSISNGESSGYVIPETDIMLNNMLGEEDLNPGPLHGWPPDTRMGSMMVPTVVLGRRHGAIALGSGGSKRIRSAVLQVLLNLLVFNMPPDAAVAAPRLHLENDTLSIEPGFPDEAVTALAEIAPVLDRWLRKSMYFGGVHVAQRRNDGGYWAAGDERRGGCAGAA